MVKPSDDIDHVCVPSVEDICAQTAIPNTESPRMGTEFRKERDVTVGKILSRAHDALL